MIEEKKMQRGLFFSVFIVVLVFLATSICFAGPGKSKGSSNTNRQSLETSKRGKERAEQRHQMKEEKKIGNEGDDSVDDDDDDEGKGEKVKKDKKKDKESKKKGKGKKDKDSDDDDNEKDDDSVDDEDESSNEKLQKETKSRRWWEFNKKSDE